MNLAKLSTAKTFLVGPILDSVGAAKTDEVIASIKVTKNGTVGAVDAQDTLTHNHTGHYVYVSDGGDFDTLGEVEFSLNSGTNAMAPVKFQVLSAATYDAIVTNAAGAANGMMIAGSNAATTFATLTVSGATALSGGVTTTTIAASGAITAASLTLSGVLQANSLIVSTTTALTGAVTLGAALTVTGTTTLAAITQVGAVSLGATTIASMAVTGALSVGGTTTLAAITQTGAVSLGATTIASMAFTGALSVGTTTTFTGAVAYSDTITIAKGVAITNSTAGGAGMSIVGNTTGAGLSILGGANGTGVAIGGQGVGHGLTIAGGTGASASGVIISGLGSGTFYGVRVAYGNVSLAGNYTTDGTTTHTGATTFTGAVTAAAAANNILLGNSAISWLTLHPSAVARLNVYRETGAKLFGRHAAREGESVSVGCYPAPETGTGNIGANNNTRWFFQDQHEYRVRQTGWVSKLSQYFGVGAHTEYRIQIWRRDNALTLTTSRYRMVAQTIDLAPFISAGQSVNTISFPPIWVEEGDYIGFKHVSASSAQLLAVASTGTMYYLSTDPTTAENFDWWTGVNTLSNLAVRIQLFSQAPNIVFIGDSIIAGHPSHYTFIENTNTTSLENQIPRIVGKALDASWQNMGIGSQTTTQISARFATDVVALRPAIAVIQGGVNDIAGAVSQSTFIANWTSMLDQCVAAGIKPIVCLIDPWTAGTTGQMQTRDTWNAALQALCVASYPTAVVVNFDAAVGMFRAGGDVGNLWDIQTVYDYGDGVHYSPLGYAVLAQAILDAMDEANVVSADSVTVSDKTGFALSSTGADLILKTSTFALAMADAMLDESLSAHDTEDTLGNVLNDLTEESGGVYRLTATALGAAPTGATASYTASSTTVGAAPKVDIEQEQYMKFKTVSIIAETAQTGDSHIFLVYDPNVSGTVLWSLTTASSEISVGGVGDLTITIVDTDAHMATSGEYAYRLVNTTDDVVICKGALTINPGPNVPA